MIHVEIVTHFNEEPYSHGLVQGLADRIRTEAGDVRCERHGAEPLVRLSTEGIAQTPNEISAEVTGCCPDLVGRVKAFLDEVRCDDADGNRG